MACQANGNTIFAAQEYIFYIFVLIMTTFKVDNAVAVYLGC